MRSGWLKAPYALAISKSSCLLIRFKVNYVRYSIALIFNAEPVKSIAYILNKNMKLTNMNYTYMEQINVLKFDQNSEIYNFWEVVC